MNNFINALILGKVLKKYNLTQVDKKQVVLLPQRKTKTWSAIYRLPRKLEFKESAVAVILKELSTPFYQNLIYSFKELDMLSNQINCSL